MPQYTTQRSSFSPWLAMIAAAAAIVIYFSVIDNELLREGRDLTVNNPQVQSQTPVGRLWLGPTPDVEGSTGYQPVLATALRIERRGWGASPSSFHSMNLILLVGLLIAAQLWATRLTGRLDVTAFVVILLAVHPMVGQSVRTIAGQGLLLALMAIFLAMYVLHAWRDGSLRLPWAITAMTALSVAAYGSHEIGLLLPAWLGIQWFALRSAPLPAPAAGKKKGAPAEPRVIRKTDWIWALAPVVIVLIGYLELRHMALGTMIPTSGGAGGGGLFRAMALAVKRLFWPVHPTLVYSLEHDATFLPAAFWGGAVLAGLGANIIAFRRRIPVLAAAFALALSAAIAIGIGFALTGEFSEAPLLFAVPGFALMLGIFYQDARFKYKNIVAIVAVVLAAISWNAGRAWHTAEALWTHEASIHPGNPYPLIQLLEDYVRQPRIDKALETVDRVRPLLKRVEDKDRVTEFQAGLYAGGNRVDDLNRLLGDEIAAGGDHTPGHMMRLAMIARMKNLPERNAGLLQSELDRDPNSFGALYDLAEVELGRRNLPRALELAKSAIKNAPNEKLRAQALARYGVILANAGLLDQAASQLNEALKGDPTQYEAYIHLARVLRDMKRYDESRKVVYDCLRRVKVASFADLAKVFVSTFEAQGQYGQGADWLQNLIATYPNDFELNLFAAHYLVEVSRFAEARKLVGRLAESATGRGLVELWNIQAMIYFFGDKNYDAAERLTRQVLRAVPGHPEASRLLPMIAAARAKKP